MTGQDESKRPPAGGEPAARKRSGKPRQEELWVQAQGDTTRFRELLIEHGHLVLEPLCNECSQKERSRIHHDPERTGAHHFKPVLKSDDVELHLAYMEMDAAEAQTYWELARGNPESFEAIVRHAAGHEFKILNDPEGYAAGRKGGYTFEITVKRTGAKSYGTACIHSHPRARMPRCEFCRSRAGDNLCDFPTGEPCKKCKGTGRHPGLHTCSNCSGTGKGTCSRRFCSKRVCGRVISKDEGYCKDHQQAAHGHGPHVRREECSWQTAPRIINRACLHQGCGKLIEADERVLYFPRRARAMCSKCGEAYLKISV